MLTDFQKLKLTKLFQVHDLTNEGHLSQADFEQLSAKIALDEGWAEGSDKFLLLRARFLYLWQGLHHWADHNQDGKVTEAEWLLFWDQTIDSPTGYDEVVMPMAQLVYQMIDLDQDGYVDQADFSRYYRSLGLGDDLAREVFRELDTDRDQRLSIAELLTGLEIFYKSDLPDLPGNSMYGRADSPPLPRQRPALVASPNY
ncbi:MAG: EF-hand domain-containing protein [Bernardetiaceae bacterium]|jgi:juvenile hormone diol kinase|nr:EF-hand domain-containing protein [Bernardetiaceae bacterium]